MLLLLCCAVTLPSTLPPVVTAPTSLSLSLSINSVPCFSLHSSNKAAHTVSLLLVLCCHCAFHIAVRRYCTLFLSVNILPVYGNKCSLGYQKFCARVLCIKIVVIYYMNILHTVNVHDVDWIGNIWRGKHLLEQVIKPNMEGRMPGCCKYLARPRKTSCACQSCDAQREEFIWLG